MAEIVMTEHGAFGEYALVVGDPARAEYLAEEFLADVERTSDARGLPGFAGTYGGKRVAIQAHGVGAPSAVIVFEELIRAGAKRIVRLGTCGALSSTLAPGDLVCAAAAIPADGVSQALVGGEPHAPMADFEIVHAAVHDAKHIGIRMRVALVATTDMFYDPDEDLDQRWAERGAIAVDMETATLLTLAPLRGVSAGSFLVCSNRVDDGSTQLSVAESRAAMLAAAPIALGALLAEPKHR